MADLSPPRPDHPGRARGGARAARADAAPGGLRDGRGPWGRAVAERPFAITEQSFESADAADEQGRASRRVLRRSARDRDDAHSSATPTDPRVTHELILDVDDFGNVTRKAAVAYAARRPGVSRSRRAPGRRWPRPVYVNHDRRRLLPAGRPLRGPDVRARRRAGRTRWPGRGWSRAPTLETAIDGIDPAHDFPYDATPTGVGAEAPDARSQAAALLRGRRDRARRSLPLGQHRERARSRSRAYRLALTAGLVDDLVRRRCLVRTVSPNRSPIPALLLGTDRGQRPLRPASGRRRLLDAQRPRSTSTPAQFYLPVTAIDPFGQHAVRHLRPHFSLLVDGDAGRARQHRARDERLPRARAVADHRSQPEPRAGRSFDALGMVIATAVMGKDESRAEGDTLAAPTTQIDYELLRWQNRSQQAGRRRAHAGARGTRPGRRRSKRRYTYSDGFGRVAMTEGAGRAGRRARTSGPSTPRWVGTGRTVFNNKGNPVKQYEPFFSATSEFEDETAVVQAGVTPIIHYDALDRVVRTEFPDGTLSRRRSSTPGTRRLGIRTTRSSRARGTPNAAARDPAGPEPVGNAEPRAAWLAARHAETPVVTQFDTLGRPFLIDRPEPDVRERRHRRLHDAFFETRSVLDIDRKRAIRDGCAPGGAKPKRPHARVAATFRRPVAHPADGQHRRGHGGSRRTSAASQLGTGIGADRSSGTGTTTSSARDHLFVQKTKAEGSGLRGRRREDLTQRLLLRTVYGEALDPAGPPPTGSRRNAGIGRAGAQSARAGLPDLRLRRAGHQRRVRLQGESALEHPPPRGRLPHRAELEHRPQRSHRADRSGRRSRRRRTPISIRSRRRR